MRPVGHTLRKFNILLGSSFPHFHAAIVRLNTLLSHTFDLKMSKNVKQGGTADQRNP
jgi:hypothetical protein